MSSLVCVSTGVLAGYGDDKVSLVAGVLDCLLGRRVALDRVFHGTGHGVLGS